MTNSILAAMINGALVSALVAAFVQVGLSVAPRRALPAAARYVVWWVTLAATVMLPLAYVRTPVLRIPVQGTERALPAVQSGSPTVSTSAIPAAPAVRARVLRSSKLRFPVVVWTGVWSSWMVALWGAVAAMMLLRLAVSCLLLDRRKRGAVAAPAHLTARVDEWLAQRRRVQVMCSTSIPMPVVAGLRHPAILIPSRLIAELQEEELEQVVLHEAAHLARRDDYALLVQRAVQALLVFHPVVRWITGQIDLEREIACDDAVVKSMGLPRRYAACLMRIVELCGGIHASWAGTGAAGDRCHLARRVDLLLDRRHRAGMRHGKARLLVAAGIVAALASLAGRIPRAIALAMPIAQVPTRDEANIAIPVSSDVPDVAASPSPAQAPAAGAISELVQVPFTVQDLSRRFVGGLGKESVRLFEDGVEQEIAEFSATNLPLSVGIVVDNSGSMRGNQEVVSGAIMKMLSTSNPLDEFFLVNANNNVKLAAAFTGDTAQIRDQVNRAEPRGATALRDGINSAMRWMADAHNASKMLLVISDGADNASSISGNELRAAVLAAKVPVYAITLASPATYPRGGGQWLGEIADQSQGHEFVTDDPSQAPDLAASVAVQTAYLIKYRSKNTARDGKFRRLRVELADRTPGTVTITSRRGYYAGGR